eukprot:8413991-Alexandrium_andersonii.AAC.1
MAQPRRAKRPWEIGGTLPQAPMQSGRARRPWAEVRRTLEKSSLTPSRLSSCPATPGGCVRAWTVVAQTPSSAGRPLQSARTSRCATWSACRGGSAIPRSTQQGWRTTTQ